MTTPEFTRLAALPGAAFAVWAAAWRAGRCSPDDVLATLHEYAQAHEVDAGAETGQEPGSTVLDLLPLVGGAARVLVRLPAPGDPQGLPPGALTPEALDGGEVVLIDDRAPGSRGPMRPLSLIAQGTPERCRWILRRLATEVDLGVLDADSPGELEFELQRSVAEAASVIAGLSGARRSGPADLRDALAARRSATALDLPPHDLPRIDRLLASAGQVDAILSLAGGSGIGSSGSELDAADSRLLRLASLTRQARAAALTALIRDYRRDHPAVR